MKMTLATSSTGVKRAFPVFATLLFFAFFLLLSCDDVEDDEPDPQFSFEVFVGSVTPGALDEQGRAARFDVPAGLAIGPDGNLYVADTNNSRIRKVTPAGDVSTFSYQSGGTTTSYFVSPDGLATDSAGENLYVASTLGGGIHKIALSGTAAGTVTSPSYLESDDTAAQFGALIRGMVIDSVGNIYVAESENNRIRKIGLSGRVTGIAGDGTPAQFNGPRGLAIDSGGNIYVADSGNNRIRKITPTGQVSNFAGSTTSGFLDGQGTEARFDAPVGLTIGPDGNLYVVDSNNGSIRKITLSGRAAGRVITIVENFTLPRRIIFAGASTAYLTAANSIYKLNNPTFAPALPPKS